MKSLLYILLPCALCLASYASFSQTAPHPVQNSGVYEFLDELAALGVIDINSVVKPYSREFIAQSLEEASRTKELLSPRQQKELDFYMLDFSKELSEGKEWDRRKDLFYYKDDRFSLTINPIFGGEFLSNKEGRATYWRNGVEARSYIGKWSFWASLRDNHEKPLLGESAYLTDRDGGHIKSGTDWSEMRGGIVYSWDWGYAGLVKENVEWGSNYNGANIFGGNNPSFLHISLNLEPVEWFKFNYIHGWLNSMVVDSTRSYLVTNAYGTDYREVYHRKNIAANMYSFRPFKGLWISAGNSIIYDNSAFNPVYLFPLFFYKSVDHQYTSGVDNMNSQMFLDISSRQLRHLHLYASIFIDELSVSRFSKPDEYNFFSYKAGGKLTGLPVDDLSVTAEFTYTFPLVFQHYVPTLTFETNGYNLGHYLKDNSREWYFAAEYKPFRASGIKIWFSDAIRGPDYTSLGGDRLGNPLIETVEWQNTSFGLQLKYQPINDLYLSASLTHSNISGNPDWTAPYFYGNKTTLSLGATFGF